jgi:hypothetical protein
MSRRTGRRPELGCVGRHDTYFFGTSTDPTYINAGRAIDNGADAAKLYNHPRQIIMVVPDGVAKVALWAPTGAVANHPKHPTTPGSKPVVVSVHDNIAAGALWHQLVAALTSTLVRAFAVSKPHSAAFNVRLSSASVVRARSNENTPAPMSASWLGLPGS